MGTEAGEHLQAGTTPATVLVMPGPGPAALNLKLAIYFPWKCSVGSLTVMGREDRMTEGGLDRVRTAGQALGPRRLSLHAAWAQLES